MLKLNNSAMLLLAASITKLYPNIILGESNSSNEGFYYDFLFTKVISESELLKIENQMNEFVQNKYRFEESSLRKINNQEYKNIIINEKDNINFYELISLDDKEKYLDFIIDSSLSTSSIVRYFKLLSLGGAYWKGDKNNQQFTRIHGVAKNTKKELNKYLELLEERKQSDHRIIGKNMNLFTFNILSGQGFPNWLEDGMYLRNSIQKYILKMDSKYGFKEVLTSIVGNKKLYEISGHLAHYSDTIFPIMNLNDEELILRPMTCPHHILLYKRIPRTYNEFPIRYSEQSLLYRNEHSGGLSGLERVRSMTLTEGHVFVRKEQVKTEIKHCYTLIQEVLKKFNIKINSLVLSLRDPKDKEKYYDDDKMWEEAENHLRQVLNELNIDYIEEIGEAAFYGPKIDIQVLTSAQKEITLSTLQLDFLLPKRFNIHYTNKDNSISQPILLHRGLIGTYERFIAILLEQTKGNLPFWLAPKQIEVIPINVLKHNEYAMKIYSELNNNFRVSINKTNDRLSKKIRDSQIKKNKYQIIIGDNEIINNNISIREFGKNKTITSSLKEFINSCNKLNSI